MKLLIVINSLATGGAEKLLLETIPQYKKEGIDVTLALLNGTSTPFLQTLESTNSCNILKLSSKSVYHPRFIFKLVPLLRQFSIVHVHLFPALYWVVFAKILSFSKATLLFTEHNTSNRRKGMVFKYLDRWIYSKYAKIVTIAPSVDQFIKNKLDFSDNRFELIHNGLDLHKIQKAIPLSREALSLDPEGKVLIQVSSFTQQKDQDTLIKSMQHLPQKVHLLLVGIGPRLEKCKELAKILKIDSRVTFLGQRMDVPSLLKTSDIVILSSHYEGLSLSSIEGLASGKPFVASSVPGLENVVENAGLLFEQGNDKELASIIKKLLENPDFYNKTIEGGLQRAKVYSLQNMVSKHINLYKQYA